MFQVFLISFVIVLLFVVGAAIGVIFKRQPLKGSCGGLGALGIERACACKEPCAEAVRRANELANDNPNQLPNKSAKSEAQQNSNATTDSTADSTTDSVNSTYAEDRTGEGVFKAKK